MKPALVVIALLSGILGSACASTTSVVRVARDSGGDRQEGPGSWLHATVHVVTVDEIDFVLEDDGFFSDTIAPDATQDSDPSFGFAVGYRVDLGREVLGDVGNAEAGLVVEHLGSGRYQRLDTTAAHGTQTCAYADFRIRFLERGWGELYGVFGLGWSATHLSPELEFDLDNAGVSSDVDRYQHGILGVFEAGIIMHLADDLMLRTGVGTRLWSPRLGQDDKNPEFERTRMVVSLGMEWAP